MSNIDKSAESHQQFTHGIQLAALRPGRVEPRRIRRHTEVYPYLTMPRDLARKKCLS